MTTKLQNKFNDKIIHNGNFCECTKITIDSKEEKDKEVQSLDFTEYLALLYFLTIEEKRKDRRVRIKKEYEYTQAGHYITKIIVYYSTDNGHKWKVEYYFDKFNSKAAK